MEKAFTINDLVELQKRLGGYFGYQLELGYGVCGEEIGLETASEISNTIQEIINGKPRSEFSYFKKEGRSE